jgi:hypothetical protein
MPDSGSSTGTNARLSVKHDAADSTAAPQTASANGWQQLHGVRDNGAAACISKSAGLSLRLSEW